MRKVAGSRTEKQVIAANIDTVFLVTVLNQDFNLRRVERYLIIARESGACPIIVLSKADLCENIEDRRGETQPVAGDITVHIISVIKQKGLDGLMPYFWQGQTVALLGSSGVGKSTLINHLMA